MWAKLRLIDRRVVEEIIMFGNAEAAREEMHAQLAQVPDTCL
jgi:hypothetical protein